MAHASRNDFCAQEMSVVRSLKQVFQEVDRCVFGESEDLRLIVSPDS